MIAPHCMGMPFPEQLKIRVRFSRFHGKWSVTRGIEEILFDRWEDAVKLAHRASQAK